MIERTNAWGDSVFPGERGYSYADEYPRRKPVNYIPDELETVPPFDAEKIKQWQHESYVMCKAKHDAYHADYGIPTDGCRECELLLREGEKYEADNQQ